MRKNKKHKDNSKIRKEEKNHEEHNIFCNQVPNVAHRKPKEKKYEKRKDHGKFSQPSEKKKEKTETTQPNKRRSR